MAWLFGDGGAYRDAENNWRQWQAKAEAEYTRQANEGINNSAYQQALAAERKMLQENLDTIRATSAITGASPAAEALARQQAMDAIAQSTAQMGANVSADKNAAMNNYLNASRMATEGINNAKIQQAQAQSQAMSGLINSVTGLASGGLGLLKK